MGRLEAARHKLRSRYIARLRDTIAELEIALGHDPVDAHQIRAIAHRLQGSGGTYGFDEITEMGAAVQHAPPVEFVARTGELIDHLRTIVEDEAAEIGPSQDGDTPIAD